MIDFKPKVVFTDIDGVWTDGGMYVGNNDIELKKFNTLDSLGVLILRFFEIKCVIITGENTDIVRNRAKKLKINNCFQGVQDKLRIAQEFCDLHEIKLKDCAFIGDNLIDYKLIKSVGHSGAPAGSLPFITREVNYITKSKSGDGAFYEYVHHLLINSENEDLVFSELIKTYYTT
jgi:3-deoxy-D-glycero-D-galacto-nononate 9-phosphatase